MEQVVAMVRAIYINRSDISWYSKNANVYRKALEVVTKYEATLCVSCRCRIPEEIASKAKKIVRFNSVHDLVGELYPSLELTRETRLFTGFDFPSMQVALKLKRWHGADWTVFCWDPPSLSHRDRFAPLRWSIDALFRFYVRRCDRFVLNIHPGLLEEIGFTQAELAAWRESGKLEQRMQDAFDGMEPAEFREEAAEWEVGILSNELPSKGRELVKDATSRLAAEGCRLRAVWVNGLPQEEAFAKLKKCRVLLAPYLPVRSLKWNYVLKLFEYLQIGRPILASDNPGNVQVAERFAGRIKLFKSGDAADLAAKLKEMLCL